MQCRDTSAHTYKRTFYVKTCSWAVRWAAEHDRHPTRTPHARTHAYLRGDHVVDNEEAGLRVGVGRLERHDVFARVLDQEVVLVQQLHLPHPQTGEKRRNEGVTDGRRKNDEINVEVDPSHNFPP